jgi:hypothetical protein
LGLDHESTGLPTHHRGACASLAAFACPGHPSAPANDHLPRSGRLASSVARLCALARPHGQPSVAASRCLESASTTNVSRHEHPLSKHHFWRPFRRASWETRRRSTSRSPVGARALMGACWSLGRRRTTLRSSGPPTASRLTAQCRLRADRLPTLCALARGGGEAPQLCRLAVAPPSRTL